MWTSVNSKNSPKAETSSGPRGLIFVHWHHIGSIWMHPNREKISRAFVSIWAFVNLMILMFLQALESIIYMLPLEKSFVSLTTLLFLRALCEPIIYMLQLKWAFCRPVIHLFPFLLMGQCCNNGPNLHGLVSNIAFLLCSQSSWWRWRVRSACLPFARS